MKCLALTPDLTGWYLIISRTSEHLKRAQKNDSRVLWQPGIWRISELQPACEEICKLFTLFACLKINQKCYDYSKRPSLLSLTILLRSRGKPIAWESSFSFFFSPLFFFLLLLTLHYQGVFSNGNISVSCPYVRGHEPQPETTLSYLRPSGRNAGGPTRKKR